MTNYINNSGQIRLGWRVTTQPVVTPYLTTLLDLYSGATAAYSLRKLKSSYTGSAIRVRRSSDNTEMNIGFDSDGNLDTYSLSAFVGTGNGFVTTWYDQSGNDRNATQATAANQPSIVSSGIVINLNNKSSISFNGSQFMSTTQNVVSAGSGGYSVFGLGRPQSTPNCLFYIGIPSSNNGIGLNNNYGTPRHYWFGNDYDSGQTFANTNSIFVASYDGAKRYTTINNVTTSANSSGKNTISPTLTIGKLANWGQNLVGYESELVIYDSNKESIRTNISNNINTYYSVYPNPTSVWNLLAAAYNADTTASSSLKTSLFASYNGESNANDSFGTNNGSSHGIFGEGGLTYSTGKIGNAFNLNGANSYVSLPNSANQFNFTGDFSVSCWFKTNTVSGNQMIFSNLAYNGGNQRGYYIVLAGNTIGCCLTNYPQYQEFYTSGVISTGTWYHLSVTRESGVVKIYLNGTLLATDTNVITLGNYVTVLTSIGAYTNGVTANWLFNGIVDSLNVWQKSLTQSEVIELYNSGNGAQYIGDNFYKPTTNDALLVNNGTAHGGLTYGLGKVGTAFQFNGTNAYVSLPDNSLNLTGDFSISTWINTYTITGNQMIFSNLMYNGGAIKGFYISLVGGAVEVWLVNTTSSSQYILTSSIISINTWYNILVTRESGVVKLYVNNSLIATDTNAITMGYISTTPGIGAYTNGLPITRYFNGKIDAVNVWNKSLNTSEITELYNSGNGKQYPN